MHRHTGSPSIGTAGSGGGAREIIELNISGAAAQGVFVGRHDGEVVFVPDVLPGERVRVRIDERRKRFARGVALDVLEASADRVPHPWAEASIERAPEERVGGADYGHIALEAQRRIKAGLLAEAFERTGRFDLAELPPLAVQPAPGDDERAGLRWRTRELLHVAADGTAGPYAARSHTVIPVSSLPLVVGELEELGAHRRSYSGHHTVQLVADEATGARVVVDGGRGETVIRRVRGRDFRVDEAGFWQVHRKAPEVLTAAVLDMVDRSLVGDDAPQLDLYAGAGLFTASLAQLGLAVTSVEADGRASALAAGNLTDFDRVDVRREQTERFLAREAEQAPTGMYRNSLVVLDPPRSGAGRATEDVVRLAPAQVLYVACDAVALARDARMLVDGGYELRDARAWDLFPMSHHFETVASFVRVG